MKSNTAASKNGQRHLVVNVFIWLLSSWLLFQRHYFILIILVPALIVEIPWVKFFFRHENPLTLLKVVLLLQGLVIYSLIFTQVFRGFGELADHEISRTRNVIEKPQVPQVVHRHPVIPQASIIDESAIHDSRPRKFQEDRHLEVNIKEKATNTRGGIPSEGVVNLKHNIKAVQKNIATINNRSQELIDVVFGRLPVVDHPDLKYRPRSEVVTKMRKLFEDVPSLDTGFLKTFKNPCWELNGEITCLPYAYILGQPKCGTSDLFERLKRHQQIRMPKRKEVRWFTRGEFSRSALAHEGDFPAPFNGNPEYHPEAEGLLEIDSNQKHGHPPKEILLGSHSSVESFTQHFSDAIRAIVANPADNLVTIDGGPHTLWWPTQSPDGALLPEDIPAAQILREMQPEAKFIVTLADPVKRMYSDYYFLDDNLLPLRLKPGVKSSKSAQAFHSRAVKQVSEFQSCVRREEHRIQTELDLEFGGDDKGVWFRASQICAHDRHKFAVGGWGRLSIGLYVLFVEKWLEQFSPTNFLLLRLEDYEDDSEAYMAHIFEFLELPNPSNWDTILDKRHFNENHSDKEPILPQTETLLRNFYKPYNELLYSLTLNDGFKWERPDGYSLHDELSGKSLSEGDESHSIADSGPKDGPGASLKKKKKQSTAAIKSGGGAVKSRISSSFMESLTPQQMDLRGLPMPADDHFNEWLSDGKIIDKAHPPSNEDAAAEQLCTAVFALDLAAVKYLLYDVGVPINVINGPDAGRNAMHCLSSVYVLGDAHPKSQVFAALKGKTTWLSPLIKPEMPVQLASVLSRDIIDGVSHLVESVGKWLLKAGIDVNAKDDPGFSPLHYAAGGGLVSLVKLLLAHGADPNIVNNQGRTPLHYAAIRGNMEIGKDLVDKGANIYLMDQYKVAPMDVIVNPGSVSPLDAMKYFNITQRPPKKIGRVLHPASWDVEKARDDAEKLTDPGVDNKIDERMGWKHGNGGWEESRLKGYEEDVGCDADQFWADEIDADKLFHDYIARSAPVLIRGLIDDWALSKQYTRRALVEKFSDLNVQVSSIPYADKFGGEKMDMTLSEYINEIVSHKVVGGAHPWYVFRGHPIPKLSEDVNASLVQYKYCETPDILNSAMYKMSKLTEKPASDSDSRAELFVNAQWALGGEGTGAPVHYHNTAWNALIYGAKKWVIYPPHNMIMSNKQILDYFETDMRAFEKRGIKPMTCVQLAGDVMIVPESWGHGVLNIQESVAMATEAKLAHWRLPGSRIVHQLPFDNRKNSKPKH